jgi:Tol biopolymer transport system component
MNRTLTTICSVALGVAAVIGATSTRAGAAPSHRVRNGAIAFWAYSKIYAIQPDGSGFRVLVPARKRTCVDPSQQLCGISEFAWSPDGQRLAFLYGSRWSATFDMSLFQIGVDGHGERRISGCGHPWPSCHDFSWSPNGSQLVVSRFDGLFVVGAHGRSVRQLTESRSDGWPQWSPDGSQIAFVRGTNRAVYVIAPQGSRAARLRGTTGLSLPWKFQWTPDSSSVVFERGHRLLRAPTDGSQRPTEIAEVPGYDGSLSPDGRRVSFESDLIEHQGTDRGDPTTARHELWTMQPDGKRRWRVYAGAVVPDYFSLHPAWSPNGRRLAFADDGLYIVGADGSHLRKLSSLGHPSISVRAEVAWQPLP